MLFSASATLRHITGIYLYYALWRIVTKTIVYSFRLIFTIHVTWMFLSVYIHKQYHNINELSILFLNRLSQQYLAIEGVSAIARQLHFFEYDFIIHSDKEKSCLHFCVIIRYFRLLCYSIQCKRSYLVFALNVGHILHNNIFFFVFVFYEVLWKKIYF